jgi:hypothetical protein
MKNQDFDINNDCDSCFYDPQSHSFHKLHENNAEIYYYTCPAKAKQYYDADGIYKHMRLEIKRIQKNWVWIIDGDNYGIKHLMYPSVGNKIVEILDSSLSDNLIQIIIINETTSLNLALRYIWKSIPKSIRKLLLFDKSKSFSELLKLDEKLSLLEYDITYE